MQTTIERKFIRTIEYVQLFMSTITQYKVQSFPTSVDGNFIFVKKSCTYTENKKMLSRGEIQCFTRIVHIVLFPDTINHKCYTFGLRWCVRA